MIGNQLRKIPDQTFRNQGCCHPQPTGTSGHHCLAYIEMMGRNRDRIIDCIKRLNESPLGAGALAGTSFPIDRKMTARLLGFSKPTINSIDSVSDRDFAIEFVFVLSLAGIHLSRLAEEIILWSSQHFNFIKLPDQLSTGSSIMPQKKNPDGAEIVRSNLFLGYLIFKN